MTESDEKGRRLFTLLTIVAMVGFVGFVVYKIMPAFTAAVVNTEVNMPAPTPLSVGSLLLVPVAVYFLPAFAFRPTDIGAKKSIVYWTVASLGFLACLAPCLFVDPVGGCCPGWGVRAVSSRLVAPLSPRGVFTGEESNILAIWKEYGFGGAKRRLVAWPIGILVVGKKARFDPSEMSLCSHLDHWVAEPKRVDETLVFGWTGPEQGSTQEVELEVPAYHSGTTFWLSINKRRTRLYLEVVAKIGSDEAWIYQLGSSHHQTDGVKSDACCSSLVYKDQGYEKRKAIRCIAQNGLGRRTIDTLSLSKIDTFYAACASFLKISIEPQKPIILGKPKPTFGGRKQ